MKKLMIVRCFAIVTLIMLILPSLVVFAKSGASVSSEDDETELTLQEWFNTSGYAINVTEQELGIEIFEAGYYQIAILAEIATYAPLNNVNWYLSSSTVLHTIFNGDNSTGDTATFNAPEAFGLALGSPEGIFYTETSLNPDGLDHVLIFANPNPQGGFIIAWEDLLEGGDKDFQDMILAMLMPVPVIRANLCIHPRTLNLKSHGRWITAFITLPQGCDAEDIDISSMMLNGTVPAESRPTAIFEFNGTKVLMVKFSRAAAIEYIKNTVATNGNFPKWLNITLTISGTLVCGLAFEGSDGIRIIHFSNCHMTENSSGHIR